MDVRSRELDPGPGRIADGLVDLDDGGVLPLSATAATFDSVARAFVLAEGDRTRHVAV